MYAGVAARGIFLLRCIISLAAHECVCNSLKEIVKTANRPGIFAAAGELVTKPEPVRLAAVNLQLRV